MNLVLYVRRRLAISVPVLLLGTFLCFVMVANTGDPLGELRNKPGINPQAIAETEHQLGLDQRVVARYFTWLGHFLSGDWGISIAQGNAFQPVAPKVLAAFKVTLELVLAASILALVFGVLVGVLAALSQYAGACLLPTLSIMAITFAAYSRLQRAAMLEVLGADYVRTARAKDRQ